jgi:hypothetical protein
MLIAILSVPGVLGKIFIVILALPLPIVALSHPIGWIHEKIMQRKYYAIVKQYCENPHAVSEKQLAEIFNDKHPKQIEKIAYYLMEENTYKDN